MIELPRTCYPYEAMEVTTLSVLVLSPSFGEIDFPVNPGPALEASRIGVVQR
ncbi:MAG: hypothetical protein H5T63_06960 [Chloroflexi bacterium]|nr:hypothetical protein [Chloroflexota bacterium]